MEQTAYQMEQIALEHLTDEEIVGLAKNGNVDGLEYLINKYKNFVRAKARTYFLIGADREDIIQEGMIGLFKAVQDYDEKMETTFAGFAQVCVTRQLYTAIRASRRKKHLPLNSYVSLYDNVEITEEKEAEMLGRQDLSLNNNPEELLIGKEQEDSLVKKLEDKLSDMENRVLCLHLLGTDYKTIANLLGKSPKTIDNALQRIKAKAGELLDE